MELRGIEPLSPGVPKGFNPDLSQYSPREKTSGNALTLIVGDYTIN